jgi:2-(3-amino-3-carboxypropyl)histidine synthase
MKSPSLEELEYDLELERVVKEIKKSKAKKVLIQLPDGLKRYATQIQEELEKQLKGQAEFFIWLGSCFGACDIPLETEKLGIDLIVQFGHSDWDYSKRKDVKVLK